jgi:arylsulfatase A-like enzyme
MKGKTNVLFILSDQHHAGLMGCAGSAQAITPNLDRLAARGLRFNQAYTQNPICTPSRVSFLSGQAPLNHGYYGLSGPTPLALPSIFGHFRAHGYRTAGIGKLHLPDDPRNWVADDLDDYGDCYRSIDGQPMQGPYWDYLDQHGLRELEDSRTLPETGRWSPDSRASKMPFEHCIEHWCVERTKAFIDQDAEAPFFIHTSLPRPHHQLTPDARFLELYPEDIELPESFHYEGKHRPPHFREKMEALKTLAWEFEPKTLEAGLRRVWRGYLACISQVDWAVGQLLDHLDARGLAEDTLVVYSSDHGAYHGIYGIPEKAPGICSEAVCRIPWIMAGPGVEDSGAATAAFIQNSDLAPTLCSLTGIPQMESSDGYDQSAVLRDKSASIRPVAVTENPWSHAIRWEHWRYVHYPEELFGKTTGELYDLRKDPDETENLFQSEAHQTTLQQGQKHLLDWLITQRRPSTVNPSQPGHRMGHHHYALAGDGKESRSSGVRQRMAEDKLDYL